MTDTTNWKKIQKTKSILLMKQLKRIGQLKDHLKKKVRKFNSQKVK